MRRGGGVVSRYATGVERVQSRVVLHGGGPATHSCVCAAFTFGKSSVEHNFQLHHTPPPPRRPLFVGCSSDPYSRPHFHCGALHPARLPSTRRPTTSQECASASIVLVVTTLIRAKTASLLEGRDPHTEI